MNYVRPKPPKASKCRQPPESEQILTSLIDAAVRKRFDEIEKRLTSLEDEFDTIEEQIDWSLEAGEGLFEELADRITRARRGVRRDSTFPRRALRSKPRAAMGKRNRKRKPPGQRKSKPKVLRG